MAVTTLKTTNVQDVWIYDAAPTSNQNADTSLFVGEFATVGEKARTLIKFPLDQIPAGSIINSATLRLFKTSDQATNTRTQEVHRLLVSFVETEATWNKRNAANNWTTAGAGSSGNDYEAATTATRSFVHNEATGEFASYTMDTAKIQQMITGGSFTNNGFLIFAQTETDDAWGFASNANGTSANHPELEINYTPPPDVHGMPVFL